MFVSGLASGRSSDKARRIEQVHNTLRPGGRTLEPTWAAGKTTDRRVQRADRAKKCNESADGKATDIHLIGTGREHHESARRADRLNEQE